MALLETIAEADALPSSVSPLEIFIAIRSDGVKGSGTATDPFNGATDSLLDPILNTAQRRQSFGSDPAFFRPKRSRHLPLVGYVNQDKNMSDLECIKPFCSS